jgi:predicted enzyme related to lactoylglutathione lyase
MTGGNMLMVVADLQKSVEFYRDFIGLEFPGPVREWYGVSSGLADMYIARGGELRNNTLRVPGSDLRLELIEFRKVETRPFHPRLQDPGATLVVFNVRDIDAVVSRAAKVGAQVITPGGKPATLGGKTRAVFVKDPTGFFVEVVQPDPLPETTAPANSNIIGARLGVTVKDVEETARFYQSILGFQPKTDPAFVADRAMTDAAGLPGAQYRKSTAMITGTNLPMDFYEYKGVARNMPEAAIHDPGISIMRLQIADIDATTKGFRANRVPIVHWSGEPAFQISNFFIMARDSNYYFLQMQEVVQITRKR